MPVRPHRKTQRPPHPIPGQFRKTQRPPLPVSGQLRKLLRKLPLVPGKLGRCPWHLDFLLPSFLSSRKEKRKERRSGKTIREQHLPPRSPIKKHFTNLNHLFSLVGKHNAHPFLYPANFENYYVSSLSYPANLAGAPGTLIFFCPLFFHQGKKRGKKEGRERPSESSTYRPVVLIKKHFANLNHSFAPVGKHYARPFLYPANFPAPGGGLIFFCPLFFHQGKKRGWKEGRERPSESSTCCPVVLIKKHFTNPCRSSARIVKHFTDPCHPSAHIVKHFTNPCRSFARIVKHFTDPNHPFAPVRNHFDNLSRKHIVIEVFNGA